MLKFAAKIISLLLPIFIVSQNIFGSDTTDDVYVKVYTLTPSEVSCLALFSLEEKTGLKRQKTVSSVFSGINGMKYQFPCAYARYPSMHGKDKLVSSESL